MVNTMEMMMEMMMEHEISGLELQTQPGDLSFETVFDGAKWSRRGGILSLFARTQMGVKDCEGILEACALGTPLLNCCLG
jgi:hypothetical protein